MFKGFKNFLLRGDVIALAVAVVIGVAFTDLVTAVAGNLIDPVIAAIGGANVNGLAWQIVDGNEKAVMDFGAVITAGLNFLIVAGVVYSLFVMPFDRLRERRRRVEEASAAEPTDVELLAEIRDLLRQQAGQRSPGQR